jgi:hypothetical protein
MSIARKICVGDIENTRHWRKVYVTSIADNTPSTVKRGIESYSS